MIWVAVIVIAAILEGMSAQLISIWFVGGGIAGMIAQLCGAPVWLQVMIPQGNIRCPARESA